jgi:GT2 family glycosyltransferase
MSRINELQIALVVPTKDRPEDLGKLLASLAAQTRRPEQLIVVDGSDPPIKGVCDAARGLAVDYVRVFPPSLAAQRNAGMRQLRAGITHAGYLDDDIVLEPDAIEQMLRFWERVDPAVGGVGFNITNRPHIRGMWLKRLFLIEDEVPGRMLRSGCAASFPAREGDLETDWLSGGATVGRRDVIERFAYDDWFSGTGLLEDVDYSFNVRGTWRLAVAGGAKLAHYSRPIRPESQFLLGKWQIVNRMYIVRKYRGRGLNVPLAWWASLGQLAMHLGAAVLRFDAQLWSRAKGNLAGIVSELSGRRERVGGHLK